MESKTVEEMIILHNAGDNWKYIQNQYRHSIFVSRDSPDTSPSSTAIPPNKLLLCLGLKATKQTRWRAFRHNHADTPHLISHGTKHVHAQHGWRACTCAFAQTALTLCVCTWCALCSHWRTGSNVRCFAIGVGLPDRWGHIGWNWRFHTHNHWSLWLQVWFLIVISSSSLFVGLHSVKDLIWR